MCNEHIVSLLDRSQLATASTNCDPPSPPLPPLIEGTYTFACSSSNFLSSCCLFCSLSLRVDFQWYTCRRKGHTSARHSTDTPLKNIICIREAKETAVTQQIQSSYHHSQKSQL